MLTSMLSRLRSRPKVETKRTLQPAERPAACTADELDAIIHLLSQPLTAFRGSLELALGADSSVEDYRKTIAEALEQADRVTALLVSLRELAASEEPGDRTQTVLLTALLKEAVGDLAPLAALRRVTVRLESKLDVYVHAESRRLRHAIFKIVHHVIECGPEGKTIHIKLSTADQRARLLVTDHGPFPGAPDLKDLSDYSSLAHLFLEATKRGSLDWVIAKRTLEAQGGTLHVENKEGEEWWLRVDLPLAGPRVS